MRIKPRIQRITITNGVSFYLCSSAILNEGRWYIYAGVGITPEAAYERWSTGYDSLQQNTHQSKGIRCKK